jgi:uncharacterized protein YndB with AHSA1/START domain
MMKWLLIIGSALVLLVVATLVVGLFLPADHVATTRSSIAASPSEVWALVSDWEAWAEWQPEITGVEARPDRDGHPVLLVTGGWGSMLIEVVESDEARRLVTDVDGGAFRGRWTYDIEASSEGTLLTITEQGTVSNPLFRAMMLFHDNHATMLAYHRALGDRLGVAVTAERADADSASVD